MVIDAITFLKIWKGEYLNDPNYFTFYEDFVIERLNEDSTLFHQGRTVIVNFRNVEINGFINLIEDFEYLPINLSNVIFNDEFWIQKGKFINFFIGRNPGNNIFRKGFRISGGEFLNHTKISSIGNENEISNIDIHGGMFETKLAISSNFNCNIQIVKGEFSGGAFIGGIYENVLITGGVFNKDLEIGWLIVNKNFQIINGFYSKSIDSTGEWNYSEVPLYTNFKDCGIIRLGLLIVKGSFVISNVNCTYLDFSNNFPNYFLYVNEFFILSFKNNIFIKGDDNSPIYINNLKLENCTLMPSNILRFERLHVHCLQFINTILLGNGFFNNIVGGNKFKLSESIQINVDVYDKVKDLIIQVNSKSDINLIDSNLNNSIFFNCNFANFDFYLENSKIDDLYLSGSNFPLIISKGQVKYTYSQFKTIFKKNDLQKSHYYSIKEIESFRNEIIKKRENIGDLIILSLNKITSNHNTNWVRSLICIILVNIVSYSFLIYSFGYSIKLDTLSFQNFKIIASYFFTYLNPIHRQDFLKTSNLNYHWNGISELIDSITKIINAYLIFQFVSSFRKFGSMK